MRYRKGSIAPSTAHDYPLLRQVLHSGFITHNQLFDFLRLDFCTFSRNAFNNRLLRLVKHRLLTRHDLPFANHDPSTQSQKPGPPSWREEENTVYLLQDYLGGAMSAATFITP